ncbi:MAG: thiosulfate oxidation carrier protein SoxY [Devosia sp.]
MIITRRGLLAGAGLGLAGAILGGRGGLAQTTDLHGLDAIWRDVPTALNAFFGPAEFTDRGVWLELPQHADAGGSVPVTVGFDAAPHDDPHPRLVHLLADGNPAPHVLSAWFSRLSGKAAFSTRIRLETSQTVTAAAEMSDGSHPRVDRPVTVSFGACAQIGEGSDAEVAAFRPVPRVSVPRTAKKGEVITLRSVIAHPMETGLRLGVGQDWIRQRIISAFHCHFNGEEVFRVRLYPAVSTNPFFSFHARVDEPGTFSFRWHDTPTGETYTASADIAIA